MDFESRYTISTEVEFESLKLVDFSEIIDSCTEKWQNRTLVQVNDSVVRLGVIQGEFHWHKHDDEDEFFYVIEGKLLIDVGDEAIELLPKQGFAIPKGVEHRTRAPQRTAIMMIANVTVNPTGD
ncbi:MAG: cupin domain-containing protein [Candidatus Thorarchaeota archaeon]|nr:cupin domain-containing protein [Candidatus Thorarchaeota archaeon]